MDLKDARPGDAIELPQGVYALTAVTHCRATALEWLVFELALGEGAEPSEGPAASQPAAPTLALLGDRLYSVTVTAAEALPAEAELTVEHMIYRLRHHGEARSERSSRDGHADFSLGQYRHYEREGHVLLFMDVHGAIQRLGGEEMDLRVLRVFE